MFDELRSSLLLPCKRTSCFFFHLYFLVCTFSLSNCGSLDAIQSWFYLLFDCGRWSLSYNLSFWVICFVIVYKRDRFCGLSFGILLNFCIVSAILEIKVNAWSSFLNSNCTFLNSCILRFSLQKFELSCSVPSSLYLTARTRLRFCWAFIRIHLVFA